jgi:broad specificity phosphatase PhoE
MQPRQIFVFRHGETDWNVEGRFQGHLDIPLNDRGRLQAQGLAVTLQGEGLEAILSSDLGRAYESARIVARRLAIPVFVDPGLREAHLGGAQGLTRLEIEKQFGHEALNRWKSVSWSDADVSYPGGETGVAVMDRVFSALERFLAEKPYSRIGVASHGGVIRRVMQKILVTPDEIPNEFHGRPGVAPERERGVPIPNGVLYELAWDAERGWRAPQWNSE